MELRSLSEAEPFTTKDGSTIRELHHTRAQSLAEAWLGIVIAYYTDWPVSFCISLLSALGYFLTRLPMPIRRGMVAPGQGTT